jgi:hypothetical protein
LTAATYNDSNYNNNTQHDTKSLHVVHERGMSCCFQSTLLSIQQTYQTYNRSCVGTASTMPVHKHNTCFSAFTAAT